MNALRWIPLSLVLLAGGCSSSLDVAPPALVGHWSGEARTVVAWCRQPEIAVALEIRPDATVTGRVGDATLADARLRSNRGDVARALDLETDWIVEGGLVGPLVQAEDIARDDVMIPFDLVDGRLQGGVHAGHGKFGDKDSMRFTASGMALARTD